MRGDYPNSSPNSALKPCKQCKCAVVFSKVLSDPVIFKNFMKCYFITWLTILSECWCNGLLNCVPFTYQIYFGFKLYTLIEMRQLTQMLVGYMISHSSSTEPYLICSAVTYWQWHLQNTFTLIFSLLSVRSARQSTTRRARPTSWRVQSACDGNSERTSPNKAHHKEILFPLSLEEEPDLIFNVFVHLS